MLLANYNTSISLAITFLSLTGLTLLIQSYLSFLMRTQASKSYKTASQKLDWKPKMNAGTRQKIDIKVSLGEV